jgi:hypothetical protein
VKINHGPPRSCIFEFRDTCTVVAYVHKRSKAVTLLSTMQCDSDINKDAGEGKSKGKGKDPAH